MHTTEQCREYRKRNPWMPIIDGIKSRCKNRNNPSYRWYGKKGIRCLITSKDLKNIWYRDMAYKLKRPSIDRINPRVNYTLGNCRFIELEENIRRATKIYICKVCKSSNLVRGGLCLLHLRAYKISWYHKNKNLTKRN